MRYLILSIFSILFFTGCGSSIINLNTTPDGARVFMLKSGESLITDSKIELKDEFFEKEKPTTVDIDKISQNIGSDRLDFLKEVGSYRDGLNLVDIKRLDSKLSSKIFDYKEALSKSFKKIYREDTELFYITKMGYRSKLISKKFVKGDSVDIVSELEKLNTSITFQSEPSGALISLNIDETFLPKGWKREFKTPATFYATGREADFISKYLGVESIYYEGYNVINRWKSDILKPTKKETLNIKLKPIITTISIMSNPTGASVEDISEAGFGYLGETPIKRSFSWEDMMFWAQKRNLIKDTFGKDGRKIQAIELNLRISKSGYKDSFMRYLKIPVGESRSFKRDLKKISAKINFSSDPEGVHIYVQRDVLEDVYNQANGKLERKKVPYKKHLGATPFTYNMDFSSPLKHGDILIFEKSGYKTDTMLYAEGESSYHIVLEPKVIKAR